MRVLITAGPTHEPIDPVRYIGNRSSGMMGAALARASLNAGHEVTLILGPGVVAMPQVSAVHPIQTTAEMREAVLAAWPSHDLLIMAAAVADFTPRRVSALKLERARELTIDCVPTADILREVNDRKRKDQRVIGFSLEEDGNVARAREKMLRKGVDLMVYNRSSTIGSSEIEPVLLFPDGVENRTGAMSKEAFARKLIEQAAMLFD